MSADDPILDGARASRCSIAGQQVVEDVTFAVPATGITAVLGRNGVGKTSTLRGILGLIQRRGEVRLAGERIDGLPTHRIVQRGVGLRARGPRGLRQAHRRREPRPRRAPAQPAPGVRRRAVPRPRAAPRPDGRHALRRPAADGLGRPRAAERQPAAARRRAHEGPRAEDRRPRSPTRCCEASKIVPILLVEQNLEVVRRLADGAIVIGGGRVVHTGVAREILDDDDLTRRLLGVHAEVGDA